MVVNFCRLIIMHYVQSSLSAGGTSVPSHWTAPPSSSRSKALMWVKILETNFIHSSVFVFAVPWLTMRGHIHLHQQVAWEFNPPRHYLWIWIWPAPRAHDLRNPWAHHSLQGTCWFRDKMEADFYLASYISNIISTLSSLSNLCLGGSLSFNKILPKEEWN